MKRYPHHPELVKEFYNTLHEALRYVARRYGYALTVHGSLAYDIDLVACPWRDHACSAETLAEAIRGAAESIIGIAKPRDDNPTKMPCGRLAWSFFLGTESYSPYIDLSIMPMAAHEKKELDGTPPRTSEDAVREAQRDPPQHPAG